MKGCNIFVCGSNKFEDREFLFNFFNMLENKINIDKLIIGVGQTGTDVFAREWAFSHGIQVKEWQIEQNFRNSHLFFERELPKHIIKHDSFFNAEAKKLRDFHVDTVVPFPSTSGELGVTTRNIISIASLLEIPVLYANEALKAINQNNYYLMNKDNNGDLITSNQPAKRLSI